MTTPRILAPKVVYETSTVHLQKIVRDLKENRRVMDTQKTKVVDKALKAQKFSAALQHYGCKNSQPISRAKPK